MAKRVKDLEGFPKRRDDSKYREGEGDRAMGFNEARSIIGELPVPEPIDFVEAEKMLYEVELKDLKGDEINLWWEVRERYHKKLKEICQRFGTSAVGTGKLDKSSAVIGGICPECHQELFGAGKQVECQHRFIKSQDNDCNVYNLCILCHKEIVLSTSLGTKEVDEDKLAQVCHKNSGPSRGFSQHWDCMGEQDKNVFRREAKAISAFLRGSV